MNDIIYNYIIQAILGAASGYITNDYAINMLFKEYTPLKIGGVIKKTRNEFIDNLSSLVENDIINKDKLNLVLTGDEFVSKFEAITEDFFSNCLYDIAGSEIISNINGIDSSIKATGDFLNKLLEKHMVEITNLFIHNIQADNFLTKAQLNKISNSLFESICDSVKSTDTIDKLLLSLYTEKGKISPSDLLGSSKDKISNIIREILISINDIVKSDDKIENAFSEIIAAFDLKKSFLSVKDLYCESSLKDIIKIDDELHNKTVQIFTNYINSEKGQSTIYDFSESLFSHIKKIDKTLFEIIDSSFEINLKSYLLENLPDLTENIVAWVNLNSKNIDNIIEEAIDEVINESDGMKGKLLSTIKNSYFNNLSEKYNIIQKIIDYIEKETEPERLSNNISTRIIEYLNNYSVGDILASIEKNNILTPVKAVQYITDYFNNYSDTIFNEIFNFIKTRKIKDVIPENIIFESVINDKLTQMIMDKILSSDKINAALFEKLNSYLNNYLEKNIDEIVSQEHIEKNKSNVKDFIVQSLNNNSDTIKAFIENEIKKTADNLKLNNNSVNISNLVSSEIVKKYNSFTDNIKNKKLSLAIDRVNKINNLNKNSSEMLRTLIINNLDSILSGSIKAIVFENLSKLSDDELCSFANDFIGRELQPIMYFGGILGASAGILLAIIQNSPPNFGAITLENMVTYSLVGFLTNVIAINMIFKPYKEIKILSKIPFLKNFSLGYIVKNKKVFAESTANFVDNNLLSKDSINEIFEKYEMDIKNSFNSGIAANDYFILHKLLTNNNDSIITGTYEFTKNLLDKNTDSLSNRAFEGMDKIKFSSLLSIANINYISNLGTENIESINLRISDLINSKMHSTVSLEDQIPNNIIKLIKSSIKDITVNYYDMTSKNLGDIEYLKRFSICYNEKYINFTNKKTFEILNPVHIESFSEFLSKRITEIILSLDSREKAYNFAVNFFNKSFDKSKTFGELLNGKIKKYINSNVPVLFNKISDAIKRNIIESKGKVSLSVQGEIKNNLGFLEKGMYNLLGGKDIVDELIYKIMVVKLPKFIDNKENELLNIFTSTIIESFYKIKVENLHNSINIIQIHDMVNSYFSNNENVEFIENKVNATVKTLINKIANINLSDILKIFSLEDINAMFKNYEEVINEISSNLSVCMIENKDIAINKIIILTNEILDKFIASTSFNDLCHETSFYDINIILNNITDKLTENDFIKNNIGNLLNRYKEYMNENSLSEFIDKNEFVKSTETFIKDVLNSDETEKIMKSLFGSIIKEATDSNFNFIHEDTKAYFVNIFVEASVKSIRRNLDTMLKTIEFDRIAREEIEAMDSRKIHEMFNSFAGKYFNKLMLYGFGGFIFGINMYVGLSITALKIINDKFFKN